MLEVGFDVVEHDVRLALIGSDNQQHTTLAANQVGVIADARDVSRENRDSPRFPTAPTYHTDEFLNHPVGLVVTTSQLLEQLTFFIGQHLAHTCEQQRAPSEPRRARENGTKQAGVIEGATERTARVRSAASCCGAMRC